MKLREKNTGRTGTLLGYNIGAKDHRRDHEVLMAPDEGGGRDSIYIGDLDVEINGAWKDLRQAFEDGDLEKDKGGSNFKLKSKPKDKGAKS